MKFTLLSLSFALLGTFASEETQTFEKLLERAHAQHKTPTDEKQLEAFLDKCLSGVKVLEYRKPLILTLPESERPLLDKLESRIRKFFPLSFDADKAPKEPRLTDGDLQIAVEDNHYGGVTAKISVRRCGLFKFGNDLIRLYPVVWTCEESVNLDDNEKKSTTREKALNAAMTKFENAWTRGNKK